MPLIRNLTNRPPKTRFSFVTLLWFCEVTQYVNSLTNCDMYLVAMPRLFMCCVKGSLLISINYRAIDDALSSNHISPNAPTTWLALQLSLLPCLLWLQLMWCGCPGTAGLQCPGQLPLLQPCSDWLGLEPGRLLRLACGSVGPRGQASCGRCLRVKEYHFKAYLTHIYIAH